MPPMELIQPIFEFLYVISQNREIDMLNCLSDNLLTLQDFLITYSPIIRVSAFPELLLKCGKANYKNSLMLCKDYCDLETML